MVISVSVRFPLGSGKHLKNKWPPGFSVAATKFHTRTRSSGRCQLAHHQSIALESFVMAFSIAANGSARNRIHMGSEMAG
jgi:hypothetical protein